MPGGNCKKVEMSDCQKEQGWNVYLIRMNNGRLYTGITTDVDRRFKEHCEGGPKAAKALKGKGPLKLVFSAQVADRSKASVLEATIKKLSKAEKEALVKGEMDWEGLF